MEWDEAEIVSAGGKFMPFGELLPFLDARLLEEARTFAGYGSTMQAVVDAYVELYARRRGVAHAA